MGDTFLSEIRAQVEGSMTIAQLSALRARCIQMSSENIVDPAHLRECAEALTEHINLIKTIYQIYQKEENK